MDESQIELLEGRVRPKLMSSCILWVILGFFVIALIWAALTEVDRTVHGFGRVVPQSNLQIISNLEGGIVEAILVRTGEQVAAGAQLIRLDQTLSAAEFGANHATIASLTAKIERLKAQLTGIPPNFAGGDIAIFATQVETERALYRARMSEFTGISGAANARIVESERAVIEAQGLLAARKSAASFAQSQLRMIRPLVDHGVEPRMALVQAENAVAASAGEALAAQAALERARANVSAAIATRSELTGSWRARSGDDLEAAQAELAARRSSTAALADKVNRTVVTAPIAGKVNRVLVTTRGGTVAPGSPLIEIVPSDGMLVIEVLVSPKDIASVRIRQQAKINITAYDSSIYGSLSGKVESVSPDASVNSQTGESHFLVRVRSNAMSLNGLNGQNLPISAGMLADVSFLGDSQSILSYILSPITKVAETALRE